MSQWITYAKTERWVVCVCVADPGNITNPNDFLMKTTSHIGFAFQKDRSQLTVRPKNHTSETAFLRGSHRIGIFGIPVHRVRWCGGYLIPVQKLLFLRAILSNLITAAHDHRFTTTNTHTQNRLVRLDSLLKLSSEYATLMVGNNSRLS